MKEISVQKKCYRGRFAPSPTGPLHFGSLVAAVGSYLDARANDGQWLMRIEDIDPPREVAGAAADILRTIEELGMHWDGPVVYQGARDRYYDDALQQLQQQGHLYGCACTRKEIADSSLKTGNNKAYLSGQVAMVVNGGSIMVALYKPENAELLANTGVYYMPALGY